MNVCITNKSSMKILITISVTGKELMAQVLVFRNRILVITIVVCNIAQMVLLANLTAHNL